MAVANKKKQYRTVKLPAGIIKAINSCDLKSTQRAHAFEFVHILFHKIVTGQRQVGEYHFYASKYIRKVLGCAHIQDGYNR